MGILFLFVFILNFLHVAVAANQPANHPYVILVSIDGYRFDYTEKFSPPHLSALMKKGTRALGLIPSFPSETFPNHYTIVTGLYPEHHGIVANSFYDSLRPEEDNQFYRVSDHQSIKDGSWYGGEPIWVAAEKQDMPTAIYFWPGSEAAIQGVRPTYFKTYDEKTPNKERVSQVLRWLKLPPKERPHFLCVYFSDVDTAGHEFGTNSVELKNAVMKVDQNIGELLSGLKSINLPINVIVVSDHGMQDTDAKKTIFLDDLTDLSGVMVEGPGMRSYLSIYDLSHSPEKIKNIYSDLKKKSNHFSIFRKNEVPKSLHYSNSNRIGDLVVIAKPPYSVGTHFLPQKLSQGSHGYDPMRVRSMMGVFYAIGPQIRKGVVLKPFQNIHIYPMIMKILGLTSPQNIDGNENVLASIQVKN